MQKYHQKFEAYLEKTQSRYTSQKKALVEAIYKTKTHFEVEDFINTLHTKKITFSRTTLYRTIKQLLEANLIQKIATQDGKVFYEKASENNIHDHLICNNCGAIIEIESKQIHAIITQYCEENTFSPEYRSLHIYGKCETCR